MIRIDSPLLLGCKPPESKTVRGVRIWTEDEQGDLETRAKKISSYAVWVPRGLLGVLETFVYGGGFGKAETRAYNIIAAKARKIGATDAIVHSAYTEAEDILPEYSIEFSLYREQTNTTQK